MKSKTFVLTDWAWENCIVDNSPNAMLPWGYCVIDEGDYVKIYRCIAGNPLRETEKAVNIECDCICFDSRMNMTKTIKWKFWLPKKYVVSFEDKVRTFFDGGESTQAQIWAIKQANGRKVIGAWWDK